MPAINVEQDIAVLLNLSAEAIAYVNETEQILSANQNEDIKKTADEITQKLTVMRAVTQGLSLPLMAQCCIASRAGNCGEKGLLAYFYLLSKTKVGVTAYYVSHKSIDHAFVLLGDISKPEKLIVVDPWPKEAHACLWGNCAWKTNRSIDKCIKIESKSTLSGVNFLDGNAIANNRSIKILKEEEIQNIYNFNTHYDQRNCWEGGVAKLYQTGVTPKLKNVGLRPNQLPSSLYVNSLNLL